MRDFGSKKNSENGFADHSKGVTMSPRTSQFLSLFSLVAFIMLAALSGCMNPDYTGSGNAPGSDASPAATGGTTGTGGSSAAALTCNKASDLGNTMLGVCNGTTCTLVCSLVGTDTYNWVPAGSGGTGGATASGPTCNKASDVGSTMQGVCNGTTCTLVCTLVTTSSYNWVPAGSTGTGGAGGTGGATYMAGTGGSTSKGADPDGFTCGNVPSSATLGHSEPSWAEGNYLCVDTRWLVTPTAYTDITFWASPSGGMTITAPTNGTKACVNMSGMAYGRYRYWFNIQGGGINPRTGAKYGWCYDQLSFADKTWLTCPVPTGYDIVIDYDSGGIHPAGCQSGR